MHAFFFLPYGIFVSPALHVALPRGVGQKNIILKNRLQRFERIT